MGEKPTNEEPLEERIDNLAKETQINQDNADDTLNRNADALESSRRNPQFIEGVPGLEIPDNSLAVAGLAVSPRATDTLPA